MRVRSKINVRHQDHYDVAIVGAGIAGLYAAFRLGSDPKFKNKSICLFEASDRLGGRMFSLDIPHVAFPIELGAMRFKPTHRILQDLVKEFGVKRQKHAAS
jgi:protoporphyrinogen oxidase